MNATTLLEYDAVVLAGGRAARLGGAAKPGLLAGGVSLLHLALDAAEGARRVVVVGPEELAESVVAHRAATKTLLTREDPPFSGPAAGIAAGLAALGAGADGAGPAELRAGAAPWVLVLAVDVPRAREAVGRLVEGVAQETGCDGAYLVDGGRAQWLVGMYRAAALAERAGGICGGESGKGSSVRRLLGGLRLLEVPDPGSLSADVDTWDDAARLGIRPGPDKELP